MAGITEPVQRISLEEAALHVDPERRHGISQETLAEWALRGVGPHKLAITADSRGWATTRFDLDRFLIAVGSAGCDGDLEDVLTKAQHSDDPCGQLIPLTHIPRFLAETVTDRTLRNWVSVGRSGIRLESVQLFNRTYVSMSSLARFLQLTDNQATHGSD